MTQDVLRELLKVVGHHVQVVGDGRSALKTLANEQFDLVLVDFHIPDMDGTDVVREYRAGSSGEKAPVFGAITADPDAISRDRDAGEMFETVFAKPFEFDEILRFIDGVRHWKAGPEKNSEVGGDCAGAVTDVPLPPKASANVAPSSSAVSVQDEQGISQEELERQLAALMPAESAAASDNVPNTPSAGETKTGLQLSKAVLIAEDSPVTQDILKLLLSSAGYDVDVAEDGQQALKMIKEKAYFLTLMDYNMPRLQGAEVVKHCLSDISDRPLPVFVAMTADPAAVLADAYGEKFSKIFTKPFNFDEVLSYIENCAIAMLGEGGAKADAASDGKSAQVIALRDYAGRVASGLEAYGLSARTARWPEDLGPTGFSLAARQYMAAGNDFDAIVVCEPVTPQDLRHLWSVGDLYLLPVIDETGRLGAKADVSIPLLPRGMVTRSLEVVLQEFKDARNSVHHEVRQSKELADKLAASMYVRKSSLRPDYKADSKLGITYNCTLEDEAALSAITVLAEQQLVEKSFFDRFHACNNCRSVHLNAREECFECRSPHLVEAAVVHHFRCAYQGPLEDFQQGADLVCPKCSRELRHFGVDYDKPGFVISCQTCGSSASDAAVGFKCIDCGQHTDGEAIETKDVFEFKLTEKGIAFVEEGHIVVGGQQSHLRFAELPLELVIELNKSARAFSETSRPFSLLSIGYPDRRALNAEHGARFVDLSRSQMIENLGNYFGAEAVAHKATDYDYILINRVAPESCRANLTTYHQVAVSGLKMDLSPRILVFGPQELFG